MRTIHFLLTTLILGFLSSCGTSETEQSLSSKLEALRQQKREITQQISETEQKLAVITNGEEQLTREPVVLQEVKLVTFKHFFEASGSVEAVNEAFISPEVNGQIMEIYVQEGDRVRKGQLLARLNTEVTEKNIAELKTSLALATEIYERQERLWKQQIGSELQYLEARNSKKSIENRLETIQAQLDMSLIYAPIDGIVEKVNQKKGELAVPGMQLIQLVDLGELYVRADISESFLPSIKSGDTVSLTFPSYPDYEKTLKINRVSNVINKNNRTFEVELRLDNKEEMLKPNMIAIIRVNDFTAENSLVIPSKIIKEDLNGRYIYVAAKEGDERVARKRYVITGRTFGSNTRVIKGLEAGDQLITDGFSRVTDGSLLKTS
ncbi:MAG: efflux RND transporter periplasmic adaptor subunit [Bacteroidales bacterium]|jgi:RND family efflux transporter MFP subunit|nr:efflux RND transporter periplasmic adaptor subunit [Bacteroidales bacterium]